MFFLKNGLKKKEFMDIDPRKEDGAIRGTNGIEGYMRVQFKKCLLCTLYKEVFIFSFNHYDENYKESYACLV
jgi:hypothetical protein